MTTYNLGKIALIKELRQASGLPLAQAKLIADNLMDRQGITAAKAVSNDVTANYIIYKQENGYSTYTKMGTAATLDEAYRVQSALGISGRYTIFETASGEWRGERREF